MIQTLALGHWVISLPMSAYASRLNGLLVPHSLGSARSSLVCFCAEVGGAELIAWSAHFPTIHLYFLDSPNELDDEGIYQPIDAHSTTLA